MSSSMRLSQNVRSELFRKVRKTAEEFEFDKKHVNDATRHFRGQMKEGLAKKGMTLNQIPSYVTAVPTGREKGLFLAVDLGGTNLRVCSIDLHGDNTYSLTQSKVSIPPNVMVGSTSHELFSFLAVHIQNFLEKHHSEHLVKYQHEASSDTVSESFRRVHCHRLGFTFSFTFEQESLNQGRLLKWTKGFDIPDMIGKEVCSLLQEEIDRLHLPVIVTALANDTVGTLMARAYTSPQNSETILGGIFGTGTNGAYIEHLKNVTKMPESAAARPDDLMIINTEWGGFDDELSVLSVTSYDIELDKESVNPGDQHFEKMVSGMYLGEVLRRTMLPLLRPTNDRDQPLMRIEPEPTSPLFQQWGVNGSLLSILAADDSSDLAASRTAIESAFEVKDVSEDDARAVKTVANAIGRRAARLAGVAVAAIVLHSGRLDAHRAFAVTNSETMCHDRTADTSLTGSLISLLYRIQRLVTGSWNRWMTSSQVLLARLTRVFGKGSRPSPQQLKSSSDSLTKPCTTPRRPPLIDVGLDGSLIELYPGFEEMMRSAIRDVTEIGPEGDRCIQFGLAKDGSGVGAALIAWAALQQELQ